MTEFLMFVLISMTENIRGVVKPVATEAMMNITRALMSPIELPIPR